MLCMAATPERSHLPWRNRRPDDGIDGEIANGAVMNVCPAEYNIKALELDKGARKAGRTLNDIDRPQLVVCSVGP